MIFVYGLFDPRDNTLFYVGLTRRGKIEPEGYVKAAHRGSTTQKVRRHLRHLHKIGVTAYWDILEECADDTVDDAERFWIASMRACGAILMNVKDGGQIGGGLGQRHSVETRALIGAKSRLKVMSPEARARISAALKLRPPASEETRHKLRRSRSDETKRKMSLAKKGVPISDETRQRMLAEGKSIGRPRRSEYVLRACNWCGAELRYNGFDRRVKQKRVYCNVDHLKEHRKVSGWKES